MYDLDFKCNYRDVILHKTMQFLCIKQKHSHMSFKKLSHLFECLRYFIHKNIIRIIKTWILTIFVRTYEKQFLHKICMNLWIKVSLWCQSLFEFNTFQILLILGVLFKRSHIIIKSGSVRVGTFFFKLLQPNFVNYF